MNALNKGRREVKKSIDAVWADNLNKLEGPLGTDILVNDKPDIISRLIKAVKDRDKLPRDLGNPETMGEVEAVNDYAQPIYDLGCELTEVGESMMVGDKVQIEYESIMDEMGETMSDHDKMVEAGHSNRDF